MYSVMPTHGFLTPNANVDIMLTLSVPSSELENFAVKLRHKFLIQITNGPEKDQTLTPEMFWKTKQANVIGEHKFRCIFDKDIVVTDDAKEVSLNNYTFKSLAGNKQSPKAKMNDSAPTVSVTKNEPQKPGPEVALIQETPGGGYMSSNAVIASVSAVVVAFSVYTAHILQYI